MQAGTVEHHPDAPSGLSQIALTKTIPPSAGRFRIERPRLLALLQDAAAQRLVLLRGPAGYGKTTLAVDWYEQLRRSGAVVAWLSVDKDDDEPSAFAYHIARALHGAAPELGRSAINLLAETKLIAPQNIVSAVLNAAGESDDEIYLFLDDYHSISESRAHDITAFLLRYAPSNFHLVVMSRTESPLPISRLQLTDDVTELDIASLRFTMDETRQFLGAGLAPRLQPADIEKLHEATEGWPAALQLARITVRNSTNLANTIRSFSGVSRNISAYIEDTLATQADEIVQFLLQTSILESFNGPLCQAVTGIARSTEFLKALDHEQLLLVTLDETEGWYRYHHLMSDFLIDRLLTRTPEIVPELHRRAYGWFASQGKWTEAVQHAIAAKDFDQALQYVEHCAMAMVVKGDMLTLLSWERKLPAELMSGQLEVKLALAWGFILVTRFAEGGALLSQVEARADEVRTPELWWRCRVTRGVLAAMSDDSDRAVALGTECLGKINFDPFYRNALYNVLRFGYWKSANLDAFYALPKPEISDGEATYVLAEQYRLCLYGMVAAQRLNVSEALSYYAEARQLIEKYAGSKSAAAAIPTGLGTSLRYETGDISGAEIAVLDELDLIETTVFHESFLSGYLVLARAACLRDDLVRALNVLDRGIQLAQERGWSRLVAAFLVERARIFAKRARPAELQQIINQLAMIESRNLAPTRCSWTDIEIANIVAKGLLALLTSEPERAAQLLQQAYDKMLLVDDRYGALRVGMDLALAYYRTGNLIEANRIAAEVIATAAPSDAVGFVLERPAELVPVLSSVLKNSVDPAIRSYCEQLLAKCRERERHCKCFPRSRCGEAASVWPGAIDRSVHRRRSVQQANRSNAWRSSRNREDPCQTDFRQAVSRVSRSGRSPRSKPRPSSNC
jgi:LuxR family maltose regulon positive regulatory protein